MLYVVLLAMVAAFLALRLYSVLGKRTGHHQSMPTPAEERIAPAAAPRTVEAAPEPRETTPRTIDAGAEAGVRQVVQAEPGFDVAQFVDGAQAAYRMILESFWKGDREQLKWLTTEPVYAAFDAAIAAREEAGQTLDNRLVTIDRATIAHAGVTGGEARIAVRFDADIAAVTRDADGQVVAGSTDDAVETHDVWTFARPVKSADPNWKLADTDDA